MTVSITEDPCSTKNFLAIHKGNLDGQAEATSLSTEELITQGSTSVAQAVTLFGSGVALWPILSCIGRGEDTYAVALDEFAVVDIQSSPDSTVNTQIETKYQFGHVGPKVVIQELKHSDQQFHEHLSSLEDDALEAEVIALGTWKQQAFGRLKILEKRVAWCLLGMEEGSVGATEVRRAFKKKLLLLHPDKGGNAKRFQLLQDMKGLFMTNTSHRSNCDSDKDDTVSVSDAESQSCVEPQDPGEDDNENSVTTDRACLESRRRELRNTILDLQTRCRELAAEIKHSGSPGVSHSDIILGRLKLFIESFVASTRCCESHSENEYRDIVIRFLSLAAELVGAAAAYNPSVASEVVARDLFGPLEASTDSPCVHGLCTAVVEAIHKVPSFLESYLQLREPVEASVASAGALNGKPECVVGNGALLASDSINNYSDSFQKYIGSRRPDGSAVYCIACDCWVSLEEPFFYESFVRHCESDFMHQAVA